MAAQSAIDTLHPPAADQSLRNSRTMYDRAGQGSARPKRPPTRMVCARAPGFSLVELVIVVTILGIIASIAIPRMTTATTNAEKNALQATLTNTRKAVDMYFAEHGKYPGYNPISGLPDSDSFRDQLLRYSNEGGKTSATPVGTYIFGPYLRSPFPRNPFNRLDTVYVKATPADADPADNAYGWVAVLSHGYFGISATDTVLDNAGFIDLEVKKRLRD